MTRISLETQERLHSLDAVRALALLLGIVLHAAASFMPSGFNLPWLIADNSPSVVLAGLTGMIHLFRMSLFFFVAGYYQLFAGVQFQAMVLHICTHLCAAIAAEAGF